MSEDPNAKNEIPGLDDTVKKQTSSSDSDKTIQRGDMEDDSTLLKSDDETRMADFLDMGILALGAKLAVVSQKAKGEELVLTSNEVVVGRAKECDWVLDFAGVSRRHFRLFFQDQKFFVEDLGSKYGTFVGKRKIEGVEALKAGDEITAGEIRLRYSCGGAGSENRLDFKDPKVLAFGGAGFLVLLILLVLAFSSSDDGSKETVISPLKDESISKANPEVFVLEAKKLALDENYKDAVLKMDEALLLDPKNENYKVLRNEWENRLWVKVQMSKATELTELGNLDAALNLVNEIFKVEPGYVDAVVLSKRIEQLKGAKVSLDLLNDARFLLKSGNIEEAQSRLEKITDPLVSEEKEKLLREMEGIARARMFKKEVEDYFSKGDLEKALDCAERALSVVPKDEFFGKWRDKIRKLIELSESAKKEMEGGSPYAAVPFLEQIVEFVGKEHALGKNAIESLKSIRENALIFVHRTYQEAMIDFADKNYKEAFRKVESLVREFGDEPYFMQVRNDIKLKLDSLAVAVFQAGYVLEEKDPMRAKKIWQRLLSFLPENHPYYQKVKSKVNF